MNNYHIYEEVGRGKYSVVYKGRKKKSIEYVAVKSVERGRRKKLMDEVAIFQQIENDHIASQSQTQNNGGSAQNGVINWHPNILKFYNWYETRNHFWIILEYCSGADLFSILEKDKKLPEDSVKKFAYELLEGLSYLHSQGIIFCDLKPCNILMNEFCKLKLCDFGLAKKVTDLSHLGIKTSAEERASAHSTHSTAGGKTTKQGSPFYMAPELFQDDGVYSYQSDFWSLGCIMIELATGKPPFNTSNLKDLIQQIMVQEVPAVRGFSDEFNDIIQLMLKKDPINRINWEEIKKHPWWSNVPEQAPTQVKANPADQGNGQFFENLKNQKYTFTRRIYQPQVQFDKYLQNVRAIDPKMYHQIRTRPGNQDISQLLQQQQSVEQQNADALRISYNVSKNLKSDIEQQEQSSGSTQSSAQKQGQYANRGAQQKKSPTGAQQNLPTTPQMGVHQQQLFQSALDTNNAENQNEEDQYNQHIYTRSSKINKKQNNNNYDEEEEDVNEKGLNNPKNEFLKGNQIEFYSKKNKPEEQKLLANKKVPNKPLEQKGVPSNVEEGRSTPNKNMFQNPNVVKQNNFFNIGGNGTNNQQQKSTSPTPTNMQTTFENRANSNQELFGNHTQKITGTGLGGNFNGTNPQSSSQNLTGENNFMDNKQRSNKPDMQRKISPMGRIVDPKQIAKAPLIIQPQQIDRINFLNDNFDEFDRFDEREDKNNQVAPQQVEQKNFKYHDPMDQEQAFGTLKMLKDMTLFKSPLSQAQVKSEIQQLVTQTVQIGPVQNQGNVSTSSSSNNPTQTFNIPSSGELLDMDKNISGIQTMGGASKALNDGKVTGPTQMKVPHKTIEQLIIHNSDTAVKPIVGNKEIERFEDPASYNDSSYNVQHLKFVPWTSDEVSAKINTTQIESHLSDVYTSIASNTTVSEKISTLQYFESIIVNSNVSNSLINSAFMVLLKRMLEQIKSPMIKIRVCSVVGLLIRHSTIIENELAEIDIASQLIDTLRDSNERVRRRAIAALGEYMFYAATQLDDEMADPVWELSDDAIDIIVQSLDDQETDQIVRFYACKTLENICAQSTSAGHRFANQKTVQQVLNIFLMEPDEAKQEQDSNVPDGQKYMQWLEGIKISAAIALSHICKLNPQLFPIIFETITPTKFCETLMHGNGQSRVQQAFITMLNLALHNIYYPQISSVLLKEKLFLQALMRLLEHQHIVIRGKCILTFLLLIKLDFRWMTAFQQEIKFFNELDKILRDNYKYVQCCLLCLADGIQEIIPTIFKTVCEQLSLHIEKSKGMEDVDPNMCDDQSNLEFIADRNGVNEYGDFSDLMTQQLFHITILLDLQINPLIRSRLLSTPMIQGLANIIDVCDVNSFHGAKQFLNALLILSETLSTNYKGLVILSQPILTMLVPVLFNKFTNSESNEIRFLSFKIYTDIMCQYISDEQVYNSNLLQMRGRPIQNETFNGFQSSDIIENTQILGHLMPMLLSILTDQGDKLEMGPTVAMFGLRLIGSFTERNPQLLSQLMQLKYDSVSKNQQVTILGCLAEFYQVNHNLLNRQTLKLLKCIIDNHAKGNGITLQDLQTYNILEKTHELVLSMVKNRQEQTLEIMLDVLHSLLGWLNDTVKKDEQSIVEHTDRVFDNFQICIQLLQIGDGYDVSLVEKASHCLIQMLQLYAQSQLKKRDIYFVESHFPFLLSSLKSDRQIIQKRVLKCVYWALIQNEYQINLSKDVILELESQIELMLNSQDRSIAQTSREVYKLLTQLKEGSEIVNEEPTTGISARSQIQPQQVNQSQNQYSQYSQYSHYNNQNQN